MNKKPIAASCASILIALVSGAAHAAVYTGIFDPDNAQYAWSGEHSFSIDDACLETNGWRRNYSEYDGGCHAKLIGGFLTLTAKEGTNGAGPGGYTETVDFSTVAFGVNNVDFIRAIFIRDNQLVGVDSFKLGPLGFAVGSPLDREWFMYWESGAGPGDGLDPSFQVVDPVFLGYNVPAADPGDPPSFFQPTGPATTVTFVRQPDPPDPNAVPEPGTFGLALLGLLSVFGIGRARQRRARR